MNPDELCDTAPLNTPLKIALLPEAGSSLVTRSGTLVTL
jgi:hypothetical protein